MLQPAIVEKLEKLPEPLQTEVLHYALYQAVCLTHFGKFQAHQVLQVNDRTRENQISS